MQIKDLEGKIDELIELCSDLEQRIAELTADQEKWSREKSGLMEKNELARHKIEAMITRLKSLEQDS